jgi:hypothetical protein
MKLRVTILLVCLIGASACATRPTEPVDASDSAMLGLGEEPKTPVWETWEPSPKPSVSEGALAGLHAFDYWQLSDPEFVESAWAPLSTLLDAVRRRSEDDRVRDGATLMLEALEPGETSDFVVDATFYVTSRREGVGLRFLHALEDGGSASVLVLMSRSAGASSAPDSIDVIAKPGYAEPSGFSVSLQRADGAWSASVTTGEAIEQADLYSGVLISQVWESLTGNSYTSARLRADSTRAMPAPFRPAIGLEVSDRDIDRVFSDSVFTPRMDDFSTGGS